MDKVQINLPALTPHQRKIFYDPARIVVCDGSTKSGKTVGGLIWQFGQCFGTGAGKSHLWLASVYPQAKIAYDRLTRWLRKADPSKIIWDENKSELCIKFANGSRWFFKGGDNADSVYGADYASAVIDEASRVNVEAWHAVRSTTTATRGPIRIIGNVKGRANWAYALGLKAKQGEQGLAYHVRTAMDAIADGVTNPEEVEDAKRVLPEHVFKELYLCEPSEDGANPFGLSHIRACIRPMSSKPPVCFGADLGNAQDYTVIVGLDEDGATCLFERWHKLGWELTTEKLAKIIGELPAMVDEAGVGSPVVDRLRRVCPNVEGFQTGAKKQMLLEGLCMSIQQRTIAYPPNSPECQIQSELEAYEYEVGRTGRVSYSAPAGLHDDCVIALALAALRHDRVKVAGQIKVEWVGLGKEDRDIWDSLSNDDEWAERLT
jgi:hypothetical protein